VIIELELPSRNESETVIICIAETCLKFENMKLLTLGVIPPWIWHLPNKNSFITNENTASLSAARLRINLLLLAKSVGSGLKPIQAFSHF